MSNLDLQHQDLLIEWLSSHTPILQNGAEAYYYAMCELSLPHIQMRPRIFINGDKWCALYGENIQDGVAGFGDSPAKACSAFNKAWVNEDHS